MRLLVLGGTHFVGRAIVEAALRRRDEVTVLNRGSSRPSPDGVTPLVADRLDPESVRRVLGNREWDAAIDTWTGAPVHVQQACRLLADRVDHYGYVSSRSVYTWPIPRRADERAPVVDAAPDDGAVGDYRRVKRGGELAAVETFGDRALAARAGVVLGPYENTGRLTWWLGRARRGGPVLAPGAPDQPVQYVDVRDLAGWMLSAADRRIGGTYNVISRPGHTTMGELLGTVIDVTRGGAELVWAPAGLIREQDISPFTDLPIWLPDDEEHGGWHDGDVTAACEAGLVCRPVRATVADTWAWLQAEGEPPRPPGRQGVGLDPRRERRALAALRAETSRPC
ncbi:NAD-dependent epimerase/dehydratase family protein [Spirillospora sp. NPDC047279]|uniref:NAD-dependent epimerase/dehydratase family protein n=1 Tax=Spirillospora sp. NPDC047279 TaxID=3155478 RepID=UPI0033CABEB3